MKRTLTVLTAAIFAGAMALPAFAQVGAGIAGNANANVADPGTHAGANRDTANSDAEQTEPAAPADPMHRSMRHSEKSTATESKRESSRDRNMGANAGNMGAAAGADANAGGANNPTGGY